MKNDVRLLQETVRPDTFDAIDGIGFVRRPVLAMCHARQAMEQWEHTCTLVDRRDDRKCSPGPLDEHLTSEHTCETDHRIHLQCLVLQYSAHVWKLGYPQQRFAIVAWEIPRTTFILISNLLRKDRGY